MTVTISDILSTVPVRAGNPHVLAGAGQLSRKVRWVHCTDLADLDGALRGDDLVLTTGLGLEGTASSVRDCVRRLVSARVAGIILELGPVFRRAPRCLVAAAEESNLPLIALLQPVAFADITETAHSIILNKHLATIDRVSAIGATLIDLVVHEDDLSSIVTACGQALHCVTILEDLHHRIIALARPSGPTDSGNIEVERHLRTHHGAGTNLELGDDGHAPRCVRKSVNRRRAVWGALHILVSTTELDELHHLVADRAVSALELRLLTTTDPEHAVQEARNGLLTDIREGSGMLSRVALDRLHSLGFPLGTEHIIAVAFVPSFGTPVTPPEAAIDVDVWSTHGFVQHLHEALRQQGLPNLCATLMGQPIAVIQLPGPFRGVKLKEWVAERILIAMGNLQGTATWTSGVSSGHETEAMASALFEAQQAAEASRGGSGSHTIAWFDDLGIRQLLVGWADTSMLEGYVSRQIGRLLLRTRNGDTRLLNTLRVVLASDGNKLAAALRLGIERKTLYRRLDTIQAMLGTRLDSHEARVALSVAMIALDLRPEMLNVEPETRGERLTPLPSRT